MTHKTQEECAEAVVSIVIEQCAQSAERIADKLEREGTEISGVEALRRFAVASRQASPWSFTIKGNA